MVTTIFFFHKTYEVEKKISNSGLRKKITKYDISVITLMLFSQAALHACPKERESCQSCQKTKHMDNNYYC